MSTIMIRSRKRSPVYACAGTPRAHLSNRSPTIARVAEWQTRTAQDRMGKPVEVRLLSRAVTRGRQRAYQQLLGSITAGYFAPPLLLAAQPAFIRSESLFRPAAVSAPFLFAEAFFFPPVFLLAAQRAFISCESFLRPAGVN